MFDSHLVVFDARHPWTIESLVGALIASCDCVMDIEMA